MATTHIGINDNTYHGRLVRTCLTQLELGTDGLSDLIATISTMLDGDGTQDAHYTYVTTKFGWADNTVSHAAYNELNALYLKLSTDASVTNVKAALAQAYAKFR